MLKFKDSSEQIHHNKLYLWLNLIPIFVAVSLSLFILVFFKFLPSKLPLFYSLPWGEKQLATTRQFFIIPAIITLITLVNLVISHQLHMSQSFLKKVLLASSLVASVIVTITFIKIIFLFI